MWTNKEQWLQAVPVKMFLPLYKKEFFFFYSGSNHSLEQLPQERDRVRITGLF